MNRISAAILSLAILTGLFARSAPHASDEIRALGINSRQASNVSSNMGANPRTALDHCSVKEGTFRFDLIDAIRQEYSRGPKEDELCPDDYAIPENFRIDDQGHPRTHIVFAIVPDPVHTNLSLLFDQQMDAVQQGVLDSGWGFVKSLMPWDNRSHPESSDFRVRRDQSAFENEQESQPGILLFGRTQANQGPTKPDHEHQQPGKNDQASQNEPHLESNEIGTVETKRLPRERLLIFVIGESPASGINKSQFRHAIELVEQVFSVKPGQKILDLEIIGPTFSGSLHSLAALLCCSDVDPRYPFKDTSVISGTATSKASIDTFDRQTCLRVTSLQENDEYVVRLFLRFAKTTWKYQPDQIAILSEDETAYGTRGIVTNPSSNEGQYSQMPAQCEEQRRTTSNLQYDPSSKDPQDAEEPLDDCNERKALHLYFPREISQLRSAYQRTVEGYAAGNSRVPRTTLPLDLETNTTDEDTVRQYSGKQLPLSQEAVLLAIVGELQAHGSQMVLLRATNALDQLFLSRYLRRAYPDARIITMSADLLLAREIEDARLHGVMALTTYSLTQAADHEFHSESELHSDRVFPNAHAIGIYNAVKLLFTRAKLGQDECANKPDCVHLFQYGWPALSHPSSPVRRPPVHLTVLGHGGFWDVAILPEKPETAVAEDNGPQNPEIARSTLPQVHDPREYSTGASGGVVHTRLEQQQPQIWQVFWIVAIVSSLAYAYFIWFPSMRSSSQAVAQIAPPLYDSRRNLLAVTALLHFSLLLTVFWPYWYLFENGVKIFEIAGLILAMAVVAVVGAADLKRRRCTLQEAILIGTCTVMPFVLIIAWNPDYFHYMSVFRSVHLASGLSELLSVFFLLFAGFWGAWYCLSGSSLMDSRCTILPGLSLDSLKLSDACVKRLKHLRSILEEEQFRLREQLNAAHFDKRALLLSGFVVVPLLWYTSARPLHSLEPIKHEYVLAGLTLCLFVALVIEVLRIYGIWMELRRLLIGLDSLPLRDAFQRLTGFSWSPLWQLGGGNLGDFRRLISRQLEALRRSFVLKTPIVVDVESRFNRQLEKTIVAFDRLRDSDVDQHQQPGRQKQSKANSAFQTVGQSSEYFPLLAPHPVVGTISEPGAAAAPGPARSVIPSIRTATPPFSFGFKRGFFSKRIQQEIALVGEFESLQKEFARAGVHSLAFVAEEWDSSVTVPDRQAEITQPEPKRGSQPSNESGPEEAALPTAMRESAEHFLALLYTSFIAIVLMRIRTLIMAVGGMYVLFVMALTTYPFQPEIEIRFFLAMLLLFIVGVVGVVYAQMHRDTTLSHITNSPPGQLGSSFWLRIASFVTLPVLSLIASGYPEIGNALYSWLEPGLRALR